MTELGTVDEWLGCLQLPEYQAAIPAGHLMPIGQPEIWIDGNGQKLSRDEYMATHNGADPVVIWEAIKLYRKQHGGGVHRA